ncbi:MAG: hypothetical protein K2L23_07905 [Odoribacter sp.]|nr:hypothetical protein [Odoribacter sp.]
MKPILLLLLMLGGLSMSLRAQNFKHFKVDTIGKGWTVSSIIDDTPDFDVGEKTSWPTVKEADVNNIGRRMLNALPVHIKKEFVKQRITLHFILNSKGEVYNISFWGDMQEGIPLTDEQWLKVFDSVRRMKSDIAKLIPSDSGKWRVEWVYPVSKYLRDAGN